MFHSPQPYLYPGGTPGSYMYPGPFQGYQGDPNLNPSTFDSYFLDDPTMNDQAAIGSHNFTTDLSASYH